MREAGLPVALVGDLLSGGTSAGCGLGVFVGPLVSLDRGVGRAATGWPTEGIEYWVNLLGQGNANIKPVSISTSLGRPVGRGLSEARLMMSIGRVFPSC